MPNDDKDAPAAKVRFPPPLVFAGFTALGFLVQRALAVNLPLGPWPRLLVAAVIALGGLALLVTALAPFKASGQNPAPWTPSPSLILRGPYRFTRNPMYVGMMLLEIAIGLYLGNLWIVLLSAPALLVVHHLAVLPEEAYLADKFGDSYERYRSAVRRYL